MVVVVVKVVVTRVASETNSGRFESGVEVVLYSSTTLEYPTNRVQYVAFGLHFTSPLPAKSKDTSVLEQMKSFSMLSCLISSLASLPPWVSAPIES